MVFPDVTNIGPGMRELQKSYLDKLGAHGHTHTHSRRVMTKCNPASFLAGDALPFHTARALASVTGVKQPSAKTQKTVTH